MPTAAPASWPSTGPRAAPSPSTCSPAFIARATFSPPQATANADVILRLLSSIEGGGVAGTTRSVPLTIQHSETNDETEDQVVAVPEERRRRPIAHLRASLATAQIKQDPALSCRTSLQVFRTYVRNAHVFESDAWEDFL